jgi:hypothetical protein
MTPCRLWWWSLLLVLVTACVAPSYAPPSPPPSAAPAGARVRESTPVEMRRVLAGLLPLMSDLGYPVEQTASGGLRLSANCGIRLAVVTVNYVQTVVLPGTQSPCTYLSLLTTEGVLAGLPEAELRALLAHELAHVHLKHMEAFRALAMSPATLTGMQFNRDQESEADRFAALVLKRVGGEPACYGLVTLLTRLVSETRPSAAEDRATHPNVANRAREARRMCEIL